MALGILMIAMVAGYLVGFVAWFMGAGVWISVGVLAATGCMVVFMLCVLVVVRDVALPRVRGLRRIFD